MAPSRAMSTRAVAAADRRSGDRLMLMTAGLAALYVLWGGALILGRVSVLPSAAAEVLFEIGRIGMLVNVAATAPLAIAWLLRRWSRTPRAEPSAEPLRISDLEYAPDSSLAALERVNERIRELDAESSIDAVALVRELVSAAFSVNASDVHLTPERDRLRLSVRVDGVLHDLESIRGRHAAFVVNRIKVMARLSIHVRSKPQDGRIAFDREAYQARVSTLPTNHGEKVVIRLAVNDEQRYDLDHIGFAEQTLTLYKTLLLRDSGVIYLTGPTGSGKTSTMYASMQFIRDTVGDKTNLVTLEDPVEVDFRGIAQTQVDAAVGLTFAVGLRSVLRQDPDVIMVGEIRDEETAQTAIRAGLTGHLLLTTVHADSTVGVFHRLKQLKVDPFQLAGASVAVVNQRLAIPNCPSCLKEMPITELQARQLELLGVPAEGPFFVGTGCDGCRGTGRRGRAPLLEVLRVTDGIRDLLIADTPKHRIAEAAVAEGMRTLGAQAMGRAHRGELPVDEVIRVLSL